MSRSAKAPRWPGQSHVQDRVGQSKAGSGGGCAIWGSARRPSRHTIQINNQGKAVGFLPKE